MSRSFEEIEAFVLRNRRARMRIALAAAQDGPALSALVEAKRKGVAWSIIGNFPEKAKLDEIAKYSNYQIRPMLLGEDGTLTEEEIKVTPIKKRFR